MGTAAQIRSNRIRAGKSQAEVAERLGLNAAWYADLEQRDEELASTLTIFQAMELAAILGMRLGDLLSDGTVPDQHISIVELAERINAHVARAGISIDQFEDQVGWELRAFLDSPFKVACEFPIMFLQATAGHLGINWLSLIPDEPAV
ncbi:MAG: helix-turn-helix domain-containing protein [Pseudomonadota bacterium]